MLKILLLGFLCQFLAEVFMKVSKNVQIDRHFHGTQEVKRFLKKMTTRSIRRASKIDPENAPKSRKAYLYGYS